MVRIAKRPPSRQAVRHAASVMPTTGQGSSCRAASSAVSWLTASTTPFDAEAMLAGLRRWVECESPTFDAAAVEPR